MLICRDFYGSDGTRTRDLRRDRPAFYAGGPTPSTPSPLGRGHDLAHPGSGSYILKVVLESAPRPLLLTSPAQVAVSRESLASRGADCCGRCCGAPGTHQERPANGTFSAWEWGWIAPRRSAVRVRLAPSQNTPLRRGFCFPTCRRSGAWSAFGQRFAVTDRSPRRRAGAGRPLSPRRPRASART